MIESRYVVADPRVLRILALAGAAAWFAGLALAPDQAVTALLLGGFLWLTLALSGVLFIALEQATGSSWSVAFRRVPEAMARALPAAAAAFAVILALNLHRYPWFGPSGASADSTLWFRDAWLTPSFFAVRSILYLGIWTLFAQRLLRLSKQQDVEGDQPALRRARKRLCAAFLVVFAFTFSLASFDWIMSLGQGWYSTIFGVYGFAGMFVAGLAMITALAVRAEKAGPLRGLLNAEHLHDLGKLIFAFACFWAYIWFCQYMLIWYANIPEETVYFLERIQGFWAPVFLLNLFLNWVAPFLILLPLRSKRDPRILVKVCWTLLAGRCVDIYLMIAPAFYGEVPRFGLSEAAAFVAAAAVFLLQFEAGFSRAAPAPRNDPDLALSLRYHN